MPLIPECSGTRRRTRSAYVRASTPAHCPGRFVRGESILGHGGDNSSCAPDSMPGGPIGGLL